MAMSKVASVLAPAYIGFAGNKVQECFQDPKCGVEGTPYSDILMCKRFRVLSLRGTLLDLSSYLFLLTFVFSTFDTRNISPDTGLTFLASALGQLQSVVYLPVKQNAYIEISESTYRHLMSLSYEWFIKKKQGDALRCMDRGITSADQVVSYLFLCELKRGKCFS